MSRDDHVKAAGVRASLEGSFWRAMTEALTGGADDRSEEDHRRPYGAGSLYARGDVWYAHWRADGGRQVKRRVGPMRVEGSREGLTRRQAEAELRRLIAETRPVRMVPGDALTIGELGRRYLANLERQGRKKATTTAVGSILRVWLDRSSATGTCAG